MPKAKIHAIVSALGSSSQPLPISLSNGTRHEWRRVLDWLDASGLALYFLERLKQATATDVVPPEVLVQLEQRQSKNRERVAIMRQTFRMLNEDFHREGVEYAALKGFSLVPEYCPDATLRALSDLDYLIGNGSIDRAEKVLAARGYTLQMRAHFPECWWSTHGGEELIFWIPASRPKREIEQYYPDAPSTIELHVATPDQARNGLPPARREFAFDRMVRREWEGGVFFSLPETEMFVGQLVHAFWHWVLGLKARPSWLFEIGCFLKHRQDKDPIWEAVNCLIDSDSFIAEVVGIMVRLTTLVFGEVHPNADRWAVGLSPQIQRWLDMYGIESVLAGWNGYDTGLFPRSKLMLFAKEQYSPDVQTALGFDRCSLVPVRRLRGLIESPARTYNSNFEVIGKKLGWFASRCIHHAGANLRYFWELPRWQGIGKSSPLRPQD
jgi:hypothetical protein